MGNVCEHVDDLLDINFGWLLRLSVSDVHKVSVTVKARARSSFGLYPVSAYVDVCVLLLHRCRFAYPLAIPVGRQLEPCSFGLRKPCTKIGACIRAYGRLSAARGMLQCMCVISSRL